MRKLVIFSAAAMALAAGPALADMLATASTNVNVRAGPGSQYPVVGVLGSGQSVQIEGCINGSRWCRLSTGEGWVSSRYLAGAEMGSAPVIAYEGGTSSTVIERRGVDTSTTGAITGGATGAVAGAIVGGPAGAAIGGVAGFVGGGAVGTAINPPDRVRTYVRSNRIRPITYDQDVVVGTTLPNTVEMGTIPDYEYRYVYLNERPVLVEPRSRRVVYVYE
jgi:uncharacterized protein YraI